MSIFIAGGNKNMTTSYERIGDYNIPVLRLKEQNEYELGFFGRRYKDYLKEKHKIFYYNLLTKQELFLQIKLVEEEANKLYEIMIESFKKQANVDEKLKADDPIMWVKLVNNIKNRAREIVLDQVIYH